MSAPKGGKYIQISSLRQHRCLSIFAYNHLNNFRQNTTIVCAISFQCGQRIYLYLQKGCHKGEKTVFVLQRFGRNSQPGTGRCISDCPGFSLLEVLIACTVFSLGMAGFTSLLLTSIIGSTEARQQGFASMAAASLSEQIRLNPIALSRYLDPPKYISKMCSGADQCTPEQQADYDFRLWQIELADGIQNARGLVCRDKTPEDGVEGDSRCDGTGPLVIKIFWLGQGNNDQGEPHQHRFTLEIS
jgi:type IV pilus modification protein PilV